jgi:tetratricopeptide (TPR) repeat protein
MRFPLNQNRRTEGSAHCRVAIIAALAVFFCGLASQTTAQQQGRVNPSNIYLQAYLVMEDGSAAEKKQDYRTAFAKYKQAGQMFDVVARSHPEWNSQIVRFRRKKVRADLNRLRDLEISRQEVQGSPPPFVTPSGGSNYDSSSLVRDTFGSMDGELTTLSRKNASLLRELEAREAELRKVKKDAVDAAASEKDLLEKLAKARGALATAEARKNRENGELEKEVARLNEQLQKVTTLLRQSQTQSQVMLKELRLANEQIRDLTEERNVLQEERNKMAAILDGANSADASTKLAANNWKVRNELEQATKTIADLNSEKEADKKEIIELREKLIVVQSDLDDMREQNRQYERQIAALVKHLDATSKKLAHTAGSGISIPDAERENRVLRDIILRQLKQQSVRDHAKRVALEDMAKLEVDSEKLLAAIEQMAQPVLLEDQEQGMLKGPRFAEHLTGTGIHATLIAESTPGAEAPDAMPGQDLNDEEMGFLTAAEEEFDRGSFHEARRHLEHVLRSKPQNVKTLINVGVVNLKLQQLRDAEIVLKKALAYEYENNTSHYLLGITYYRQGSVSEAIESVEQGLKIEPQDAQARNYLGYVFSSKNSMDRARNQFEQAVNIDSTFAAAHFNLAAIYATDDDPAMLELARKHYGLAIENGAEPDESMEKLLGLPPEPVEQVSTL